MSVRTWIGAVAVAGMMAAGCVSTPVAPQARTSWTDALVPLGIDGSLAPLAQPRLGSIQQVRHCATSSDSGVETVVADLAGPGCVVRLWARDLRGTVRIYVDGAPTPALETSLSSLFNGQLRPFEPPLTGQVEDVGHSYVPIPFREGCRITVQDAGDGLCFETTYAAFPEGTPIDSFSHALSPRDRAFFKEWRAAWNRGREIRFVDRRTEEYHKSSRKLWPEENVQFWTMHGPATITELELWIDAKDPEILSKIWLAIHWEGQERPAVLAPVSDFFGGAAREGADYGGPAFGRDGTRLWCRMPMPFRERAVFRIINHSESKIDFAYGLTWRPEFPPNGHYFHAAYNESTPESGRPYTAINLAGPGHYAGCTLTARSAGSPQYLDGRVWVAVDGSGPETYEPGSVASFFNAPAGFEGAFRSMPTHGCTALQAPPAARVTAYRFHVTDPVPFGNDFALLVEHGVENTAPATPFSSVVYWYHPEPTP